MTTRSHFIRKLKDTLFKCKHEKINSKNRLSFCPDCGKKINISWLAARCSECKALRETILVFGMPYSRKKKCEGCGNKKYTITKLKPNNFELDSHKPDAFVMTKDEIPLKKCEVDYSNQLRTIQAGYLEKLKNNISYQGLYKINSKSIK
jgi:hypothetical protein